MEKKFLTWLISGLLLVGPAAQFVAANQKQDREAIPVERVKAQVAKLGLGEKARATITLKDGSKAKGYVARAGDDEFVMRDHKTDNPTTIRYSDVAKVDEHKGHSTAKSVGISAGVGAGVVVGLILLHFAGRG